MRRACKLVGNRSTDRSSAIRYHDLNRRWLANYNLHPARHDTGLIDFGRFPLPLNTEKGQMVPEQRGGVPMADKNVKSGHDEHYFKSREFERGAVSISAEIREAGAGKQRVSIIDLSRSGFRMHCIFLILPERTVYLSMPGFGSMEARIAWHEDVYYGCQFEVRLHEAVYDHVIRTYPLLGRRS